MRVFVAGPYGDHNPKDVIAANVARADQVGRGLVAQGHQVYVPHTMSHGWEDDARLTRDQFITLDNTFLEHWAEAIVRIPGESPGADAEMALAKRLGLVVLPVDGNGAVTAAPCDLCAWFDRMMTIADESRLSASYDRWQTQKARHEARRHPVPRGDSPTRAGPGRPAGDVTR